MVGCRTKVVRSKMSDIVLVEVMSLAEVRLQEGESIENALRQVQTQGSDGRHHQGSEASLVLPEAGREAPSEGSLGAKACSQENSQRARLSCHKRGRCCQAATVHSDRPFAGVLFFIPPQQLALLSAK